MFDYFKAGENDQFLFLQLPIMLIKDELFKSLSSDSKILYSLLLNRTSLSIKNNWLDEHGNIFIIYTIEQIMEDLNCWEKRAVKAMKELRDIGLVKSIRQGLGKPNILYVMNFATALKYPTGTKKEPENPVITLNCQNDNSRIVKRTIQEPVERTIQELSKGQCTYIDFNNIDSTYIESKSMSTSDSEVKNKTDMTLTMTPDVSTKVNENKKGLPQTAVATTANSLQSPSSISFPTYDYNTYRLMIQENIDYSHYKEHQRTELDLIDELIECMLDVICTGGNTVKIGGEEKNRQMVISQYMKITSEEINHIIGKFKEQHHRITHTHSYLKTMLYTIRQEIGHHYTNAVRADGVVW